MKNLFYFNHLNSIGGIEQFFAYLAEKYRDWDITIVYRQGDVKQISRLRKWVRVEKFTGRSIECDKAFYCFNSDIRHCVKAKESALVLHGDYKTMIEKNVLSKEYCLNNLNFDKYYGVSKQACDAWKELTGKDCELIYNPIVLHPKRKIFRLVYCGRLTPEKGGDLLKQFVSRLDELAIEYQLFIYSNKDILSNPNVFYLGTRLDIDQFLTKENFDFIIIPSKTEGYCYSLVQALSNGLPAIVTPCPVFKELGVNKDNSIMIDFDGSNMDEVINSMISKKFDFKYIPKEDNWNDYLAPGKSYYEGHIVKVKAIIKYFDLEMMEEVTKGEVFFTSESRSKILVEKGCVELVDERK